MLDLYNNKYDRQTLKDYIFAVKLIDILKTQILDVTFVVRYILNQKYQLIPEDSISAKEVLQYQPHIKEKELYKYLCEYESDDDSIVDFDTEHN